MRAQPITRAVPEPAASSLRVNAPDDRYEQEASRAADAFVRGRGVGAVPFSVGGISIVQRCTCGQKAGGECDGCRKKRLQRSTAAGGVVPLAGTFAPPVVADVLASSGQPLDRATRSRMEAHFGADFSGVRVHADRRAAESAAAVNAEAWTVGSHIAFADGTFRPHTTEGQHLLAHELAHVVQQAEGLRRRVPRRGVNPLVMDEYDEAKLWEALQQEYKRKVQLGELDDSDLSNWAIVARLNGLKSREVDALIGKITQHGGKNPKLSTSRIVEYLEVRKTISTPLPSGATVARDPLGSGGVESYSLTLGTITVMVKADTFGSAQNETGPTTNFPTPFSWRANSQGIVTSLTRKVGGADVAFNPTSFEVTVETKYKDSPDSPSAYGRGTTSLDQQFDATTLRVHEGSHGTDYIAYLRSHPFPVDLSKGVVGVLTHQQMTQVRNYITRFFREAGNISCEQTDQVGTTQDRFLTTPAGRQSGIRSCKRP